MTNGKECIFAFPAIPCVCVCVCVMINHLADLAIIYLACYIQSNL